MLCKDVALCEWKIVGHYTWYKLVINHLFHPQGYTVSQGSNDVSRDFGENTASFAGLSQCMDYTVDVDVNIKQSTLNDVLLQHGSVVCRTTEERMSNDIVHVVCLR